MALVIAYLETFFVPVSLLRVLASCELREYVEVLKCFSIFSGLYKIIANTDRFEIRQV